jgi:hypothetical protein
MRRFVASVLLTTLAAVGLIALTAGPAAAHTCPGAALTPVGVSHSIQVFVRIEQTPVTAVDVTLPAGVQLDHVDPREGWTATTKGSTVHYQGGEFAQYTCEYFPMEVTVAAKGTYPVRVVTRDRSGNVAIDSAADPVIAQNPLFSSVIYAGTEPPRPGGSGSGTSPLVFVGIGVVVLGLALAGFLFWRGRRNGVDEDTREDELQARVDEVRKRTSGRPGPD